MLSSKEAEHTTPHYEENAVCRIQNIRCTTNRTGRGLLTDTGDGVRHGVGGGRFRRGRQTVDVDVVGEGRRDVNHHAALSGIRHVNAPEHRQWLPDLKMDGVL